MKERPKVWIFLVLLGIVVTGFIARYQMAKTPISLASVGTSRESNGCQITMSVDRRDGLIGLSHGAPPLLQRAWLSDGQGHELAPHFLTPLTLPARDTLGSRQFGWLVTRKIPRAPGKVVFHAAFTAPGAPLFRFEQELRSGIDFNYKDEAKKK